jgi:tRNA A-37 threonylcarbamoyl transferase component Bud32
MVDALVSDRPVIAMMVEEYANSNASKAVHFKYIIDAGVYDEAHTTEAAATNIGRLLDGIDSRREARTEFTRDFVRPYGRNISAGFAASKAIEMAASGESADRIHSTLRKLEAESMVSVS